MSDAPAGLAVGALKPHQLDGVRWLVDNPRSLLADDVGLGKTVTTCGLLAELAGDGRLGRVLLIVPAQLIEQWRGELARWLPSLVVHDSTEKAIRSPTAKQRAAYPADFPDGPDVLLVSYEFATSRVDYLESAGFSTIILDEAQVVRGAGKKHAAVCAITLQAERVHALTASPFENDALESFSVLEALHLPDLWSRATFERRFIRWSDEWLDGYGRTVARKPEGLIHTQIPALKAYLERVYLRRVAEGVGLKLPVRVGDDLVWVPLLPDQRKALNLAEIRWKTSMKLNHAREAATSVVNGRSSKAEAARDFILTRPDEPKFIVWAFHKEHLSVMEWLLDDAGVGWVRLDGETKPPARKAALARFEDDPKCRVLLGTDVLGVGLNLQHCRVMLSLGSTYNPGKEKQREGRIRRIGSPHDTYEHVTFLNTAPHEQAKATTLQRKSDDARSVFGQAKVR